MARILEEELKEKAQVAESMEEYEEILQALERLYEEYPALLIEE